MHRWSFALFAILFCSPLFAIDASLEAAIDGDHRSAENRARDVYRKPGEVLDFLGFQSDMTVVEIWPGWGWYTEILAPALQESGKYYAAIFRNNNAWGYERRANGVFLGMLGENNSIYRDVQVSEFSFPYGLDVAPAQSADMVLTFRNVHNWVMDLYGGGRYAGIGFEAMYDALKPGGILGVVDHRWPDAATEDLLAGNGYISVERTVALAESVGFELVAQSDILANPLDAKDYPEGVWTLPPTLALGEESSDQYLAIGESDRFLLKFVKPQT